MILILILLLITHPGQIMAVNIASPTATLTISPTITPDNMDEIQKIRLAVQEKVKEKLNQIVKPDNTKKGIIGTISQIDTASLTISQNDSEKTINTIDSTAIFDINRKKIDISKLKVGQSILAMGYFNSTDSFDAKRIVVNDPDFLPVKSIIIVGKIVDRSQSSDVALLVPTKNKENQYQITFTALTTVVNLNGKKMTVKDITTGKKVIAILSPNTKNKTFTTDKVILVDKDTPNQ